MAETRGSIQLLGPIIVEIDGVRISHFRSHKTLVLLAYLIVENRPLARDFLAEIFWPDSTIAVSRGHLRRALYDLAHKLPGWIILDHDVVNFNRNAQVMVDLYEIESFGSPDESPVLEKALETTRGEFLEGISLVDCPQVEHWLWSERENWRRRVVALIEQRCGRYTQASQYDRALDCSWKLVKLQPWREDRYRNLMVLLVRNGDIATALKVYARCRQILAQEIEMEPANVTTALYDRIRKLLTQTPSNLTPEMHPQRAWTQKQDQLIHDITGSEHRLITITGPEYSGRDALAHSVATRVNGRSGYFFIDGVFQAHLGGLLTTEETAAALGHSLRITAARKVLPLSLVLTYLRDKEMLLLLIDLEVSGEHRDMLSAILDAAPAVKMIVTARDSFHLPEELVITLNHPGSSLPNGESVPNNDESDPHEYLGLFV